TDAACAMAKSGGNQTLRKPPALWRRGVERGRILTLPRYCDGGTAAHTRPWLTMIPSTARVCNGMRATIRFVLGSIRKTAASTVAPSHERTRSAVTQMEPAPSATLMGVSGSGILVTGRCD